MRDILDKLQLLIESTGLAGRAPGAVFKNEQGDEITFNGIQFYPQGGGKFTPDQLQQALDQVKQLNVQWLNSLNARVGGFGIASFTGASGDINVGQYFQQINPNLKKNYMPNTILGYSLQSKASKKSQEKLKPQDLLTNKVDLSIADIMNQLSKSLGVNHPLYAVAHKVAMGEPLPFSFPAPEDISFTGFRDYFCEILQPIAIIKGQYTGNAGEAAEKFLNGSFNGTVITFDESVTAGLSDSILSTKDGKYVLISTKGGKGAKASAKNLYDKVLQLEQSKGGDKFLAKYKDEVEIIKNIVKFGQNGSPLYLATKYKIIDEKEAEQIRNLRNTAPINLKNIDKVNISSKLKKFAIGRTTKTPESTDLYYHIMAVVAEKAAEQVNEKTNFSKAAAEILNNGALIQVYTKAKEGAKEWTLQEFNTVYPSDQIKGVYLDSGKTYYSTDIKGNYTFMIDKGEGKPKDEPEPVGKVSANRTQDTDDLAQAAADIVNPRRKRKPEVEPGLGREKRVKTK
jgi:hypothetical protein